MLSETKFDRLESLCPIVLWLEDGGDLLDPGFQGGGLFAGDGGEVADVLAVGVLGAGVDGVVDVHEPGALPRLEAQTEERLQSGVVRHLDVAHLLLQGRGKLLQKANDAKLNDEI